MPVPNYNLADTVQPLAISRVLYATDDPTTDRLFMPVNAPAEGPGGGGIDYGTPADNKEAQRLQSLLMTGYNIAAGVPWGQAVLGSNQTGIASITLTQQSGTGVKNTAQVWSAAYVLQPSTLPPGNLTYTWVADGAGLTANAGSAVPGQAAQRSFTPTVAGTMSISCTITSDASDVTGSIGYSFQVITDS